MNPRENSSEEQLKKMKRRKQLTLDFLASAFWNELFEPSIKKEIEKHNKITKVEDSPDDKTVAWAFRKAKNRVSVYKGIHNKIYKWAELKTPHEGGKEDGR